MTLDQLKVLSTIIETGSFSAAAEKLNRVQSAVSIAIKRLEESLSVEIFNREGYRPELTDAGKEIHRQALNILKQSDFLNYTANQLSIGEESEIAIAIDGICPLQRVTPILKIFNKEHPHVRIQLYIEYLGGMERLNHNSIDLAFTQVFEWPVWTEAMHCMDLPVMPVASPEHALYKDAKNAKRNMEQHTQIVVSSSQHASLSVNVSQEAPIWQVGDFSSKQQLLKEGFGWGYMPQHLIQQDLDNGDLVMLNLRQNKSKKTKATGKHKYNVDIHKIYLVRRNDKPIGPMATKFWNLFEKSMSK
jgi:DNA-binding transcriptional LysR family regulator